ncbi:hypothetical protein ABZ714_22025 [Streptomyces sp. NPDC006798]|uniref:hypothetical protein n=1 Tax=Streptomyces sp. NPDC006798 TaxID=3155462 RepID=UPI00340AAC38
MTQAPSRSTTSGPATDDWTALLTQAFGILLDRPLTEYDTDAEYGVYLGGNFIHEIDFDHDPAWVTPAALSGAEPVVWDYSPYDRGEEPVIRFDASRSIYEITGDALPPAFTADLAAACFTEGMIRGADLAPLLARHGIDLNGPDFPGEWAVYVHRMISDGTLFDAMRVATGLGHGPESLLEYDGEADEEWREKLEAVPHAGLRAHLAYFCDDGTNGLMFYPTPIHTATDPDEDADDEHCWPFDDCREVARWDEGQNQFEFFVVRLSDTVAGRPTG